MSWRDAPLYIEAHDLASMVHERVERWRPTAAAALADGLCRASQDLLVAVSLALTFPLRRSEHLRVADEAVVRTRVLLRLALDGGLISPGWNRQAAGRLLGIGRMIGGWRKRCARLVPDSLHQGTGPPPGA